jgi:hypothetical protein
MVVVKSCLKGSGFPAAVLARAGPALRPGGGRRIEDSLSLKPELDHSSRKKLDVGSRLRSPASKSRETDEVEASVVRRARYTEERVLGDWFPDEPPR